MVTHVQLDPTETSKKRHHGFEGGTCWGKGLMSRWNKEFTGAQRMPLGKATEGTQCTGESGDLEDAPQNGWAGPRSGNRLA